VSTKPIVPQNLFVIPNNKLYIWNKYSNIFQGISKQFLKTTHTLRLGQLLKITPDLKIYMWQKVNPKKPIIAIKMILEHSVTTRIKIHSEVNIIVIKVDNQMVVIKVQIGKNTIENVLLDGGKNVNIITKTSKQN
jgi:hypothetical protein